MFVVFKAWAHFNLDRIFTSVEVKYLYRFLAKDLESLSLYKLLEALMLVDPCQGAVCLESMEPQQHYSIYGQFIPVLTERKSDGKLILVEQRERKR